MESKATTVVMIVIFIVGIYIGYKFTSATADETYSKEEAVEIATYAFYQGADAQNYVTSEEKEMVPYETAIEVKEKSKDMIVSYLEDYKGITLNDVDKSMIDDASTYYDMELKNSAQTNKISEGDIEYFIPCSLEEYPDFLLYYYNEIEQTEN